MMLAEHRDGPVLVTQPAHAWLAGQLARAWGNDRLGRFEPWEEVCLAAEQHDVGMTAWEQAPSLNAATGLPTTFMEMDLETHLRQWTEGPERVLSQSRYAALLTSMHGSALFDGRREEPRIAEFLAQRSVFEQRLIAELEPPPGELMRNQQLLWTWDSLSLGLILGWAPWSVEDVPAADGVMVAMHLGRDGDVHTVAPWPFTADRVKLAIEGRRLGGPFSTAEELRDALLDAPWVKLSYELRPG